MALQLGTDNKTKMYALIAGLALAFGGICYEAYSTFFATPSAPTPPAAQAKAPTKAQTTTSQAEAPQAKAMAENGLDPSLHFDRLAMTEGVEYHGSGRNIFSGTSEPVQIEAPISAARNNQPTVPANLPPPRPQAPAIDLKYFGYQMDKDKSMRAYFVRGDDIFMARSGDVIDHRFKVGTIKPTSAEVTDMNYNNTQTLTMAAN